MKRFHKALAASFKTEFPTLCKYWLPDISTVNSQRLRFRKKSQTRHFDWCLTCHQTLIYGERKIGLYYILAPGFLTENKSFLWELFPENKWKVSQNYAWRTSGSELNWMSCESALTDITAGFDIGLKFNSEMSLANVFR